KRRAGRDRSSLRSRLLLNCLGANEAYRGVDYGLNLNQGSSEFAAADELVKAIESVACTLRLLHDFIDTLPSQPLTAIIAYARGCLWLGCWPGPCRSLYCSHPGRATRLAKVCDRGTALSALTAMEFIVRDLS